MRSTCALCKRTAHRARPRRPARARRASAGWFAAGWLLLLAWGWVRWGQQRRPGFAAGAVPRGAAAAGSRDPLVHFLAAAAPPGFGGAALAAAVEMCVYDAAAGAAGLWLMGARWWLWCALWVAWACATIHVYGRSGGRLQQQQQQHQPQPPPRQAQRPPQLLPAAAAESAPAGSAAARLLTAALLQLALPVFMGWAAPWP